MNEGRPPSIPVIVGTTRKGRFSEPVARFVLEQVRKRAGIETTLLDIREIRLPEVASPIQRS